MCNDPCQRTFESNAESHAVDAAQAAVQAAREERDALLGHLIKSGAGSVKWRDESLDEVTIQLQLR